MRVRTSFLPLAAIGLAFIFATTPARAGSDPLEPLNRRIHAFNGLVQGWVLTPAAQLYVSVTPPGVRRGVANALANLGEPVTAVSSLEAGEARLALNAVLRFGINTTLGLGGVRDAAAEMGFARRPFAATDALCAWGVPSGPFLVLPVLGPSTLRDAAATIGTHAALAQGVGTELVVGWRSADMFAFYADIHEELAAIEAQALDSYALHRSAYLQRRAAACAADRLAEEDDGEMVAEDGALR